MKEADIKQSDFAEHADRAQQRKALKILGADYLATGELMTAGDSIRFTLRLVEADTGRASVSRFSIKSDATARDLLVYVRWPPGRGGRTIAVPPMELAFSVRAQSRLPDGGVVETQLRDGGSLKSGDQFQIEFKAASDSWVYIFLVDSSGKCSALFPYPGVNISNRCLGGVTYAVPDPGFAGGSRWFVLDENPGTETLYIVASYEPVESIDAILESMSGASQGRGSQRQALAESLRDLRREERRGGTVPGITIHEGGSRSAGRAAAGPLAGAAGEVLRGRFAVVREFTIVHR